MMRHLKYLAVGIGLIGGAAVMTVGAIAAVLGAYWLFANYPGWSFAAVALVAAYGYGRVLVLDDERVSQLTDSDEDGMV